ncbi:hypothetical protein K7432_001245 [Basidiobolus ranarum]|uniref:Chromatin assembly factor 1 subunit A n=1 Tax=Basidiobolus ranarum TaxID=34480 RepID=A0ABR2W9X5_9FUNG
MPSKSAPNTPKKSARNLLSFFSTSPSCTPEASKIQEKDKSQSLDSAPENPNFSQPLIEKPCSPKNEELVDKEHSVNSTVITISEDEDQIQVDSKEEKNTKMTPYVYIVKRAPKDLEIETNASELSPQKANLENTEAPSEVDTEISVDPLNVEPKDTSNEATTPLSPKPLECAKVVAAELPGIPKCQLVELKNERLIFHEKKISFLLHPTTIIELASFHVSLEGVSGTLLPFPLDFHPLLCKLIQDSDLALSSLVTHVMDVLCPTGYKDEDSPVELPKMNPRSVENAILLLARHHNYIDSNSILGISHEDERPCSNLAIVRWEVQNLISAFSPDLIQIIERRREKRKQASLEVKSLFDSLPDDQKEKIRTIAQSSKRKRKAQDVIDEELRKQEKEEREARKRKIKEQKEAEKKHLREQKEVEKRLQKEEERKKKEDAQKQKEQGQTRLQGFFSSIKKDRATTSQPESYFDELFRPFHVKQYTSLAPVNRFAKELSVDYEDVLRAEQPASDIELKDLLDQNVKTWKSNTNCTSRQVRSKWLGDDDCSVLVDSEPPKTKARMKLLQFAENHRPAYYGTWSKKSQAISGRKCFAKDPNMFDYDYDSEAEWEEDEEGEECKSDDDDSEDDPMDVEEDQEDGWLVPTGYLSEDEMDEDSISGSKDVKDKNERVIKSIVPLTPVILGPVFESKESNDTAFFPGFRIQGMYGVQFSVNPFEKIHYPLYDDNDGGNDEEPDTPHKVTKKLFPEERVEELLKIVSGSTKSVSKLVEELKSSFTDVSKIQLEVKLKEIASKERCIVTSKQIWRIKEDIAKLYNFDQTKSQSPSIAQKILNTVTK